jgi:hypothetical protein
VAEHGVDAVQMRGRLGEDKELGPVGVGALVGHGQKEWPEHNNSGNRNVNFKPYLDLSCV